MVVNFKHFFNSMNRMILFPLLMSDFVACRLLLKSIPMILGHFR